MRSSKQRSRNKNNRNRSVGNVVNRVFDSSGPEGKVRGTPQQIIDKYNQLARDSQLSGDRVATENFQQHSEHYTRMLAEAMREQEARREVQEQQQRERQQNQQQRNNDRNERDNNSSSAPVDASDAPQPHISEQPQPDVAEQSKGATSEAIEVAENTDTGLVETPESKPAPKPRTRRPRKKPVVDAAPSTDAPKAAE